MFSNTPGKIKEQHLRLINAKFDELDILVHDYLQFTKNRGGTLGFCVGSLAEKLRYCRMRLNNMCGKFSPYKFCPEGSMTPTLSVESNVNEPRKDKCINVWHIIDLNSIGINWVKGNIPEWQERIYLLNRQYVVWRDKYFEIEADVEKNTYGATVTIRVFYEGKRHRYQFTKFKYMAGSSGDPLPVITSEGYRIHIRPFITGLSLSDIGPSDDKKGTNKAFTIMETREQMHTSKWTSLVSRFFKQSKSLK